MVISSKSASWRDLMSCVKFPNLTSRRDLMSCVKFPSSSHDQVEARSTGRTERGHALEGEQLQDHSNLSIFCRANMVNMTMSIGQHGCHAVEDTLEAGRFVRFPIAVQGFCAQTGIRFMFGIWGCPLPA